MPNRKATFSVFFSLAALVVLTSIHQSVLSHYISYLSIVLLVVIVGVDLNFEGGVWSLLLISSFVVIIFASYTAPLTQNTLLGWDQHATIPVVESILSTGYLPTEDVSNYRLLHRKKMQGNEPIVFLTASITTIISDMGIIQSIKILPLLILPTVPIFGYCITSNKNPLVALLWVVPVFMTSSAATTWPQLISITLSGLLIMIFLEIKGARKISLLFLSSITLVISHVFTPTITLAALGAYAVGNYFLKDKRSLYLVIGLSTILFSSWIIYNNTYMLRNLGTLLFLGIDGAILRFSPPANPILLRNSSRGSFYWIGDALRNTFMMYIGLVYLYSIYKNSITKRDLLSPHMLALGIGAFTAFSFNIIIPAVDFNRGWLHTSIFAGVAVVVISERARFKPEIYIELVIFASSILYGVVLARIHYAIDVGVLSIYTPLLLFLPIPIVILAHSTATLQKAVPFFRKGTKVILTACIIFAVVGNGLVGIPPSAFSEDLSEESLNTSDLYHYHLESTYSLALFSKQYIQRPVVADRQLFWVYEMRFRYPVRGLFPCYTEACGEDVIIWFDNYEEMWYNMDGAYQPGFTSFPEGEGFLSVTRNKIYDGGRGSVYD